MDTGDWVGAQGLDRNTASEAVYKSVQVHRGGSTDAVSNGPQQTDKKRARLLCECRFSVPRPVLVSGALWVVYSDPFLIWMMNTAEIPQGTHSLAVYCLSALYWL